MRSKSRSPAARDVSSAINPPKPSDARVAYTLWSFLHDDRVDLDDEFRRRCKEFVGIMKKREKRLSRELGVAICIVAATRHIQPTSVCREVLIHLAENPSYRFPTAMRQEIAGYALAWRAVLELVENEDKLKKAKKK